MSIKHDMVLHVDRCGRIGCRCEMIYCGAQAPLVYVSIAAPLNHYQPL